MDSYLQRINIKLMLNEGDTMKQGGDTAILTTPRSDIWLKRIARASAWLLLVMIIVLLISGWGITHTEIIYKASFGLIDRGRADSIHRATQIPAALFFTAHVLLNVRLNLLSCYRRKSWLLNGIIVIIGVCVMGGVIYMQYFA